MQNVQQMRKRYEDVGVKAIPLPPNRKAASVNFKRPSEDLWEEVDTTKGSNIGVVPTGHLVIVDVETQRAFKAVIDGLSARGIDPGRLPLVQSASGVGRHLYLKVNVKPDGNSKHINKEIGQPDVHSGELRYGTACYCVAPRSYVNGNAYRFLQGQPEWIPGLPTMDWSDLDWLLPAKKQKKSKKKDFDLDALRTSTTYRQPPIPLVERDLPEMAKAVLAEIGQRPRRRKSGACSRRRDRSDYSLLRDTF